MKILKLFFIFLLLYGCKENVNDKIEIIGFAENAKAGAIVTAKEDQKIFYIEGINYWDNNTVGKIVKVSGRLLIEKKKEQSGEEEIKHQITGIKRIIKNSKWELVK